MLIMALFAVGCHNDTQKVVDIQVLYKKGDYKTVINRLNYSAKSEKLNPQELELRAKSYERLGFFNFAIKDFIELTRIDNRNVKHLTDLGDCYLIIRQADSALLFYNRALELDTANDAVYNKRGTVFLSKNDIKAAFDNFRHSLKLNGNNYEALNNIGLVNEKLGKYDEAIKSYSQALKINKRDSKVFFNRAVSYMYLNKFKNALLDFNSAIDLDSANSNYLLNRGMSHYLLSKKDSACYDWSAASKKGNKEASEYLKKYCN